MPLLSRRKLYKAALLTIIIEEEIEKERSRRKIWTRGWLRKRERQGFHDNLFKELALTDQDMYRRCLRMDTSTFEELLSGVTPLITTRDTPFREALPAALKLSITLRFLATGESQTSLQCAYRVSQSAISKFLPIVCLAITKVLKMYMICPSTEDAWKDVSHQYWELWNFPSCIGALDGKHVTIDPPTCSGSLYFNYKLTFSIVLIALVDANMKFIYADVGTNGRVSDGGVWSKCDLKKALDSHTLNLPSTLTLPGTNQDTPCIIVADDAFPLGIHLMKPYSAIDLRNRNDRRIFNYRLTRARCSEDAFGILANRFLIYRAPMRSDPEKAMNIVMATLSLHNWLRTKSIAQQREFVREEHITSCVRPTSSKSDTPTSGLSRIRSHHLSGNRTGQQGRNLREKLCAYVNGAGSVEWQNDIIH